MNSSKIDIISEGTLQTNSPYTVFTPYLKKILLEETMKAPLKRARINFHTSSSDLVQEMIICMHISTAIDVHSHINKSESFHIIDGTIAVVLFEDNSFNVLDTIYLSSDPSIAPSFYRLNANYYHLVVPLTEYVFMHETTTGPFQRSLEKQQTIWSSLEGVAMATKLRVSLRESFAIARG